VVCPSVTPTPTASVTPTPTRTPSVTPSRTASVTPSRTPTASRTPSVTPSRTPSVTPTVTPSRTPSITPSPSPQYVTAIFEPCCPGVNISYFGRVRIDENTFGNVFFLSGINQCVTLVANGGPGGDIATFYDIAGNCSNCILEYDTLCPSPTPTPTPSITRTPSPTRTASVTPSRTASVTPSRTPTPSPTRPAGSASVTPTRTPSPTPTPPPCSCDSYEIDTLDPSHIVDYTDCNGISQSLNDPNFWLDGTLNICACGTPSVLGGAFFGNINLIGSCGDCECTEVYIDANDIGISDNNTVYFYYQCCDGSYAIGEFKNPGITNICLARANGLVILQGGQFNIAPSSTATFQFGCGGYNQPCGTPC
jgi:hypothetical protein